MTVKVYININNQATFVCPECQHAKTTDVSMYKKTDKAVIVKCKCKCGNTYTAILERRKHYRKETRLPGAFSREKGGRGLITITDVSVSGLGFELSLDQKLEVGEKILVEFNLDDQPRSPIKREAVVRSVRGNQVGAEFCSMDHYDRLGGYLL